jgi:hypothetical protein
MRAIFAWAGAVALAFSAATAASADVYGLNLGIPESSSWAMMLIGFAGIGYAAFRRGGKRPERLALGI